ncbi:winged helix-turn-helix transcriptional regulator, partial [Candidatus Woesearchaeota archaeon]|nr:winged helix-turn-helix transcriptional regulator [Candidatus Woesearchaeota archaeon]
MCDMCNNVQIYKAFYFIKESEAMNISEYAFNSEQSETFFVDAPNNIDISAIAHKERGLRVRFEADDFFRIVFYRPKSIIPETIQKILETIKENPTVTRKELASIIGVSENGIKFHITNLKKKGLLKRVGPDKGGYWKVIQNEV